MLNVGWYEEDGMPSKGYLKQEYYSGEGKGLEGCKPSLLLRSKLRCLVHIGVLFAEGTVEDVNGEAKSQGLRWDYDVV